MQPLSIVWMLCSPLSIEFVDCERLLLRTFLVTAPWRVPAAGFKGGKKPFSLKNLL